MIRHPKKYIDHQLHDVHLLLIDHQEVLDAANAKKGDLKKFVSKFVENLHLEQQHQHHNGNGVQTNGTKVCNGNGSSSCKGTSSNGSLSNGGTVAS